jgi:hypothetical protein
LETYRLATRPHGGSWGDVHDGAEEGGRASGDERIYQQREPEVKTREENRRCRCCCFGRGWCAA